MAESLPSTQSSIAARMAIAVGTCSAGAASAAAAWGAWPAFAAAGGAAPRQPLRTHLISSATRLARESNLLFV